MPNCLKNWPVALCIKAIGKNTTTSQSVIAIAAIPISLRPSSAATSALLPIARKRWIFSNTTMESSTRIPIHSAIPISDIILKVKPARYIRKKVAISEVGIAIITAIEDFQPRRNRYKTSPVVTSPSSSVFSVLLRESRTKCDWS